MKWLLASAPVQYALPKLAAGYLHLARACQTYVRDDTAKGHEILARHPQVLACFWHGRLLAGVTAWRGVGLDMLISRSVDGRLIAATARHFGHGYIEGSTARGGRNRGSVPAGKQVVERLRAGGRSVGITPDGPRGPRMRASEGAVRLAAMAGVPLVPVSASVSPGWRVGSWDRMIVPLPRPFTKVAFLIGDPISVPSTADDAAVADARARLEASLNALSAEADVLVGAAPVQPAAPVAAGHA